MRKIIIFITVIIIFFSINNILIIYADEIRSNQDFMYINIYYCPYCGEKNEVKNNFCIYCGTENPIAKYIKKENYNIFKNIAFTYRTIKLKNENSKIVKKALWRSALLPGWGQYTLNRIDKAVIYFGLFSASAGVAVNAHVKATEYYKKYNSAVTSAELAAYRKKTEDANKNKKIFSLVAGLIMTVNFIDLNNDVFEKFAPIKIDLSVDEQQINIEYKRRF